MSADYSRVHRLLRIITLVQGGGEGRQAWTPARLADACETTERSIYRDIECIQAAGIPLTFDKGKKTYVIASSHYLPPTQLTPEEALAVMALAETVGHDEQVPHLRPVLSAAHKLRSQLDPACRQHIEKSAGRVSIRLAATNPPAGTESAFEKVKQAVASRTVLDVAYDPPNPNSKSRGRGAFKLHPYELVFDQRAWYIVGHSEKHGEVRTFKLSRFDRLLPTSQTFELPKGWSLEKHRGYAWRMVKGDRRHDVELVFTPGFGETIADTQWHRTQNTEELEDGSTQFTCTVDGLDEIVWWVLSMGPNCRVIKPQALADRVRELAEKTAAVYAPAASASPPNSADNGSSKSPRPTPAPSRD